MRKPLLSPKRRVGILGGMGPAATVDLMAKVLAATPARRDEDHVPLIVWNVPQIPSRPAALRGEGPSPLPDMVEGARFLEQAGATALAIACNTAHHWAVELQQQMSIPLLHIAEAAVEALAARHPPARRVALLGTRATIELGIYGTPLARRGIAVDLPDAREQEATDRAIAHVKSGELDAARKVFLPVAEAILARGADAIVLGCTELPLIACPAPLQARLVDPTDALARAIVKHASASIEVS